MGLINSPDYVISKRTTHTHTNTIILVVCLRETLKTLIAHDNCRAIITLRRRQKSPQLIVMIIITCAGNANYDRKTPTFDRGGRSATDSRT